ncbi:MAG: hypothetical protein KAI66_03875, partial [Lentisphaeria bacterium]|nr:hypothetical protein [Lentisphaeria bacterium]
SPRNLVVPGVFLTIVLITISPSLCLPTAWDDLVYHVVLPARWLAEGYPAVYPDLVYSGFPALPEHLFWLMAPVDLHIAARFLVYCVWLLTLLLVYRLARRHTTRLMSVCIALGLGLSRSLLLVSADVYVDGFVAANTAALALVLSTQPRRALLSRRWAWVLIGVLCGGAAATKLTGLAVSCLPVLWLLMCRDRRPEGWKNFRRSIVIAAVAGAVFIAPFYLRPFLATGDPFYPYFAWWFGGNPARMAMSHYHHEIGDANFGVRSLSTFFHAPILMAISPNSYDGGYGYQMVLFLALCVGTALHAFRRRRLRWLAPLGAAFLLYCFWFFTSQQARFLMPCALLMAVSGVPWLRTWGKAGRTVLAGLLIVSTIACFRYRMLASYLYSWKCAGGAMRKVDYVYSATGDHYLLAFEAMLNIVPPNGRVLLLFEHRALYAPRDCLIGSPLFQERFLTPPDALRTPDDILKQLRGAGITHVLLATVAQGPDQRGDYLKRCLGMAELLRQLVESGRLRQRWTSEKYDMYELAPPPSP